MNGEPPPVYVCIAACPRVLTGRVVFSERKHEGAEGRRQRGGRH